MPDLDPSFDPLAPFRLAGRVALVTGASSGLGARFARVLAAAGARVAVTARRADRLEALAAELPGAVAIPCDLVDAADRARLLATVARECGPLDVLVNNAGRSEPQRALDETDEHFRATVELNLVAPFSLARDAARAWIDAGRGGTIVNVASIYGLTGIGRVPEAGYAASKGGLVALTRELAAQWGRRGIRVNALAPGWFESEMTAGFFADERLTTWLDQHTSLERGGRADELDGALLFLASDASAYVTGHVLCVDGGWTAR